MKSQTQFLKIFAILTIFTAGSLGLSFGCSVLAGETTYPRGLFARLETRLNQPEEEIHDSKVYSVQGVKDIHVESGSTNVEVVRGTAEDAQVDLKGRAPKGTTVQLEQSHDEVRVKVQFPNSTHWHFESGLFNPQETLHLRVVLPKSYRQSLNVKVGSGDVNAQSLELANLEIHAGSGNIKLDDVTAKSMDSKTGSGDQQLSGKFENLMAHAGSGNISLEKISARVANANAGSGNIEIKLGDLNKWTTRVHTGSGNISEDFPPTEQHFDSHELRAGHGEDQLSVETGSGNVHLSL